MQQIVIAVAIVNNESSHLISCILVFSAVKFVLNSTLILLILYCQS